MDKGPQFPQPRLLVLSALNAAVPQGVCVCGRWVVVVGAPVPTQLKGCARVTLSFFALDSVPSTMHLTGPR